MAFDGQTVMMVVSLTEAGETPVMACSITLLDCCRTPDTLSQPRLALKGGRPVPHRRFCCGNCAREPQWCGIAVTRQQRLGTTVEGGTMWSFLRQAGKHVRASLDSGTRNKARRI